MAFFRVRGNSITLLHGVRVEMGVRHQRLHTFRGGVEELRKLLEPSEWSRFQVQVEQSHPQVLLDWPALRQQAEELCHAKSQAGPTFEQQVDAVKKASRQLVKALHGGGQDRELFARAVGPSLLDAIEHSMRAYSRLGMIDQSELDLLLKRLIPDPETAEAMVDEGRDAFERGAPARAKAAFQRARAFDPTDPDILNSEAIGWMERGELEKAEELLVQARTLAYHQLPHRHRAYSWYQHEVRPYIRATFNLSHLRQKQGRWAEALDLCRDCLKRCPNDGIGARFLLGPILQRLGRLREAAEEHRKACEGNLVDHPDSFFDLCNVELQLGRGLVAVEAFMGGLATNHHVPVYLLKPPRRYSEPRYIIPASVDAAKAYAFERAETWPDPSLEALRKLWKDRVLRSRVREITDLETALESTPVSDKRSGLVSRLFSLKDNYFSVAAARELYNRALNFEGSDAHCD